MLQEQMIFAIGENSNSPKHFSFGGNTAEEIYEYICSVVDDREYVKLNKNKTGSTISIFDSVEFRIRINSKTQCLDTENSIATEYVSDIHGATVTKNTAHFPLMTDEISLSKVKRMIQSVYEDLRSKTGGNMFGCCNSYVQCSDAGYCLHLKDREYWGCCYRKNLEAGRIFYGKNKNI